MIIHSFIKNTCSNKCCFLVCGAVSIKRPHGLRLGMCYKLQQDAAR
jgi:hypothetical protein